MKKRVLLFLVVCLGWISGIVPCARAGDASRGFAFTDKVVLAYYYIWFSEDNWIKAAAEGGRKEGLEGLLDEPRTGQPRKYTAETERTILRKLDEPPPKGYAQWNGRLLGEKTGIPDY